MKFIFSSRFLLSLFAMVFAATWSSAYAQSSWNLLTGGDWNVAGNWTPSGVPNATDTAITTDLDGDQIINLQANTYTIGSWISKGGTNTTTLSNGTLNLAVSSGTPLFDMQKGLSTISANLTGTQGFEKTGAGQLTLGGNNSGLSGDITVTQGKLFVGAAANPGVTGLGSGDVYIKEGAAVQFYRPKLVIDNDFYAYGTTNGISTLNFLSGLANLNMSGKLTIADNQTLDLRDATVAALKWSGELVGSSSSTLRFVNGSGSHLLKWDASGFSGTVVTSAGGSIRILVGIDDAFGKNNSVQIGKANPILSDSATDRVLHSSINPVGANSGYNFIFGDSTNYAANTGKLTFTGGMSVNTGSSASSITTDGITVEVQGKVTGGNNQVDISKRNWTKKGSGTLILSGSNSDYSRNTTISAGTLLVNGSIAASTTGAGTRFFVVENGAILGGKGSITGRKITIEAGGILAPGDSTTLDTTGTLTVNYDVTFEEGAIFRLDLRSDSAYDKLIVGGIYDLNLTNNKTVLDLRLNDQFDFQEDMVFTIAQFQTNGLTGQFDGIGDGDIFTRDGVAFKMAYLSNSIELTVVPEPSVLALMGIALTGVLVFRRRRG